jgi:two-component system cell cycle sensor histidine kinase/response regulator CckA
LTRFFDSNVLPRGGVIAKMNPQMNFVPRNRHGGFRLACLAGMSLALFAFGVGTGIVQAGENRLGNSYFLIKNWIVNVSCQDAARHMHHPAPRPLPVNRRPGKQDFALGFAAPGYSAPEKKMVADFVIMIEPPFWETLSLRLLMLLAVAGMSGLVAWQLTWARVKQRLARLEQQRALAHERARLATVMEASSDLVACADQEGRLLHLNPAGRRLLGLDLTHDLAGFTLAQMHPAETSARVAAVGIPTARREGIWEGETILKHRDGHEIPVTQTIMAHWGRNDGDSFLSTIARDITLQKLAEQASERLQAQLLQAQKMESVGRLAGGIAHDFNNMLQVIIGNADLALEDAPLDSELHAELLEIQKSARRSAELTSQLLTFARKQVFRAEELNLGDTVTGTSKMLQRLIGEHIKLVLNVENDLWPVRMDPSQVTQILTNLAINARDAITGQGQLAIRLANVALPRNDMPMDEQVVPGEYVLLSVQDNGEGMTPQVMEHLFEPFFTTKEVGKGTGLGLATIFGIVKQNHGFIQVESAPRQGAAFRIFFPRSVNIPMNTPLPSASPQPIRGTETILIVEDEENILQLIVLTLRRHGYQIIAAPVPEMALIMAASHPGTIDLLVTDIVMPGMNGKQLQEKLAVIQPRMKSLFMSGYTSEVIAQHGDLEPRLNFLQKPFTIQGFLEKVRKTLESR